MKHQNTFTLQKLKRGETETAYALLVESTAWLKSLELPHWQMPKEVFEARFQEGCFYGAFADTELVGVVSLSVMYRPLPWEDLLPPRYMWLSGLHVARNHAGLGVGSFLLQEADDVARSRNLEHIFLECYFGNSKLPAYYGKHGYKWLERRTVTFDDGVPHDDVLMQKHLTP
jgi:GNAT superfamily N-acetyltransferase